MIHQAALIRRELWEHRAIYITPAIIGLLLTLMTLTGQVQVQHRGEILNITIMLLSIANEAQRAFVFDIILGSTTLVLTLAMWIMTIFYCLDSLYAERKDKSILFWRSMPVTDAETVLSKLVTAVIAIPLTTILFAFVTHFLVLVIISMLVGIQGGNAGNLVWSSVSLPDIWQATLIFVFAVPMWLSPFIGWFLFVSAFAKRMPFMFAFMPIAILPMLEGMTTHTTVFAEAFFLRTVTPPLFDGANIIEALEQGDLELAAQTVDLLGTINLGRFLSSPDLWIGVIVCGLFTTAAIYVRRFRDES